MGKVFGVVSGKGGVGKSTISVGLGLCLAQKGYKVLLVDMDEGLRCLDLLLGVDKTVVFDLSDILNGKDIGDAVYESAIQNGLFLIPAAQKTGDFNSEAFSSFVSRLEVMYDVVIFDFPAGIDIPIYKCLPDDTQFLTVAVPDPISVRDASAIADELSSNSINSRLIINRFKYKIKRKYRFKNIDDIIDSATLQLIGIVPESDEVRVFSLTHSLPKRSNVMKAFTRIATRMMGESTLLPKIKKI